jgi:hypothetical protein
MPLSRSLTRSLRVSIGTAVELLVSLSSTELADMAAVEWKPLVPPNSCKWTPSSPCISIVGKGSLEYSIEYGISMSNDIALDPSARNGSSWATKPSGLVLAVCDAELKPTTKTNK